MTETEFRQAVQEQINERIAEGERSCIETPYDATRDMDRAAVLDLLRGMEEKTREAAARHIAAGGYRPNMVMGWMYQREAYALREAIAAMERAGYA